MAILVPCACGIEISLLLILGAPRQQRQAVQPRRAPRGSRGARCRRIRALRWRGPAPDSPCRRRHTRCGTQMPSSPSSAICGRTPRSNWCARSSSRMRGATARAAHSRTRLLEQLLFLCEVEIHHDKRRILAHSFTGASRVTEAPRPTPRSRRRAAVDHGDLEMIGAAEERARRSRLRVGIGRPRGWSMRWPPAVTSIWPASAQPLNRMPRSMFVTRLPNRSTPTTCSRRSPLSVTVGVGHVEHLPRGQRADPARSARSPSPARPRPAQTDRAPRTCD